MSTKDILLADINEAVAKRNNMKFEDYQKAANESFATDRDAEKGVINSAYDVSKANAQAVNDKAVNDTKVGYESEYQKNAVQKLINEKKVAETNANLGLTDSGLNRTQQTAVQLSYANQKGKIDLARQGALDDLALNLTSALTEIETNRSVDLLTADQKYNDKAYLAAQTNYNNDLTALNNQIASGYEQYSAIAQAEIDAAADVQKAAISASAKENESNKTLWYYTGTYDENKNPIFRNSQGKTQAFGVGVNPYTNENNKKYVITDKKGNIVTKDKSVLKANGTDTQKAAAYYGVCENGYQPKGVVINGEKQGTIKAYDAIPDDNEITGKKQNVWYTKETGKYWIWYGRGNTYVEVKLIDGAWTVV